MKRTEALRPLSREHLGVLLHDHVRFEERQLFPIVEEALDDEAAEAS